MFSPSSKSIADDHRHPHRQGVGPYPRRGLAVLAVLLTLMGCHAPARIGGPAAIDAPATPYRIDGVPFFPQAAYQCGPAALAMALVWSGVGVTPSDLTVQVFTPSKNGSLQSAIIGATRRHDRIAYRLAAPADLAAEISAGNPVLVLQNLGLAWFPVWHYALVVGIDPAAGTILLHSGQTPDKPMVATVFMRTWARSDYWGLIVLPPSRLPATVDEMAYLRAVDGLERMERWAAAETAYRTALARWPDSLPAYLGLGVCTYRQGNRSTAETIFRTAAARFPHSGAPLNNLAQVLSDQGRRAEALDAIQRAIARGGPLTPQFEATRDAIILGP